MRALASFAAVRALSCVFFLVACAEPNRFDPNEVMRPDALDGALEVRIGDAHDGPGGVADAPPADNGVGIGIDSELNVPMPMDSSVDTPSCGDGPSQICCEGATRSCTTACGTGLETCRGGVFSGCAARQPTTENCSNSIDDDCDGMADCLDSECPGKICATEKVCSGKSCVSSRAVFLFLTQQKYDGALGGRDGADAKCLGEATMMGLVCKNSRAFIGVSPQDSIASLAGMSGIPGDRPVTDLEGAIRYPNLAALVSGETNRSVPVADFDGPAAPAWWSGAIDNGLVEANYTCRGWTSNSPDELACVGVLGEKLDRYCYNRYVCASSYRLACVCW
jgi:hypothetical protein